MKGRHVILVVEDRDADAEPYMRKLDSMGYACLRASSLEEVREAVQRSRFCCVSLDLEIPSRRGMDPEPEGGLTAADEIRRVFCVRDDRKRCHLLPIVGVSGHLGDPSYLSQAYENGIDRKIDKPILKAQPPLKDVLDWVFEKSGRTNHSICDRRTREARGEAQSPSTSPTARHVLGIGGGRQGQRSLAQLDGKSLPLQKASFLMVVGLVLGVLRSPDRWIHRNALGCPKDQESWEGPKRLKQDLKKAKFDPELPLFENFRVGEYRLHPDIDVDWDAVDVKVLEEHGDGSVQELAEEMSELLRSR